MVEVDPVAVLRQRARILHRRARANDPEALAALRPHEPPIQRQHALTALALALGFQGWKHASDVLSGTEVSDAGALLYPKTFGGSISNVWCSTYEEARAIRAENDGYLLPYRRQFFVAERYFIEALGLDPDDADWERIGRDWARPRDRAAWSRLVVALIEHRSSV